MFEWLNGEGSALKHHIPGETNYLKKRGASLESGSTRPFPNNFLFISESILSEDLRNELYKQVVEQKKSLRAVSDWYRIDMRRVAAVVRLVELERRQRAQVSSPCSCIPLPLQLIPSTNMMSQTKKFD